MPSLFYDTVPTPTKVGITNPVTVFIGSSLTLNCTVELSSAVDVPVIVNTMWTRPGGIVFTSNNSLPAMRESSAKYTSMAIFNDVGNGRYACTVGINSMSQFVTGSETVSSMLMIVVGKLW